MHVGHYISGAGHVGLVVWAMVGGMFTSEPYPFEVTEVSVISAAEFEALTAAQRPPVADAALPRLESPDPESAAPDIASTPDTAASQPTPPVAEAVEPDPVPEAPAPPVEAEVEDAPPQLQPPAEDVAILLREPVETPRPAPRVAPEPVAQPEPDVEIDEQRQDETSPDPSAETRDETREETAPEAATTEIVTEAEDRPAAPVRSLRPRARPERVAAAAPAPQPEADSNDTAPDPSGGVNAALAAALAGSETPAQPSGPPLSRAEKDGLRVAVQRCWVVDVGSQSANVTVTVALSMDRSGKVVSGSLRMLGASGGDERAINVAFQAARRALLRCQKGGYELPPDKYEQWRDIEMTFNPERMRIK